MSESSEITKLLQEWSQGDSSALEKIIPLVFQQLRDIAGRLFRRESEAHTLQPTALVSEVYMRLHDQRKIHWQNSEQFFGVAAMMMRRILVDYAKGRQAAKRGGGAVKLPLDDALKIADIPEGVDMVGLDEALTRLAELDPRQGRVVELHFYMGLSHEEIAEVLKISTTTVKREWRSAKLWLYNELTKK